MPERAGLDALRAQVRAIEGGGVDFGRAVACLGQPVDAALPWGGLPYRALHEVSGPAATSAVAAFARRLLARGGALVWCRNAAVAAELGELYGPGLARFGLGPERLIVARCADETEVLWSFEEALRCRGVACAVAELGRLDLLVSRRLQLAVEAGGGAGLVLRPTPDPAPNAALTRWRAEPLAAADGLFWRLILWRSKGGAPGVWLLRWDEQALAFAPMAQAEPRDAPPRATASTG
jgi:protein ImuA